MPSPKYPWKKGKHDEYTCFVVEVEVAVDQAGVPWSAHRLQDQQDHDLTRDMPSGGLEYVAYALVQEAVKREALLQVLLKVSNDSEFKGNLLNSQETPAALVEEVTVAMMEVIKSATRELAPAAARAALDMVRLDPPTEN